MTNKKKLNEFLAAMGELYKREISKVLSQVYWQALKDYSNEEVNIAFSRVLSECTFFPVPAEIIKRIPGAQRAPIEYWGKVISGLECGKMPKEPEVQEVIKYLGGWNWLQTQTYDELIWIEKRFNEYFEVGTDRNKRLEKQNQALLQ